jgi:Xaa-Pro dipeptidase
VQTLQTPNSTPEFGLVTIISVMSAFKSKSVPGLGWTSKPVFQLGEKTLAIPMSLHKSARQKLVNLMLDRSANKGVILVKGGEESCYYDSDTEHLFRQDSWFNYLFGVKEPGFFGTIELSSAKSTLFIPRHAEEYSVWCGAIYPPDYFKTLYDVDDGNVMNHL